MQLFARTAAAMALLATPALSGAQVSLRTVVDLAQRESTTVRIAQADLDKARAVFSQSRDVIIPSLTFGSGLPTFPSVGFTGTPSSIWSATVQSLAFSLPQKRYIDAARLGVSAATARLKDAREQASLDASITYIELDTVLSELQTAQQQEELSNRLIEIEQQRAEAGVDPLSELLQAKLTAANLRLARLHLERRAATLSRQITQLTGLPEGSIKPDHTSIPEIPNLTGDVRREPLSGIKAAQLVALSKYRVAKGDQEVNYLPQLGFFAQYNRNTTLLNNADFYYAHKLPPNNFSSGISLQIPLFDLSHHAKARESRADALRARVEAEQAQRVNDLQIVELNGTLKELGAQAEIAQLKQQIAASQLNTVHSSLENGNGASGPGSPAQLSPKSAQLAQIDERQKFSDSQEADLLLAKARLGLLRALGHMQDWLDELHTK